MKQIAGPKSVVLNGDHFIYCFYFMWTDQNLSTTSIFIWAINLDIHTYSNMFFVMLMVPSARTKILARDTRGHNQCILIGRLCNFFSFHLAHRRRRAGERGIILLPYHSWQVLYSLSILHRKNFKTILEQTLQNRSSNELGQIDKEDRW